MTQKKEKIWSQIVFWAFIHILWSSWGKFTNLPFPRWKERINKLIFCFILIEIKICFARETWRQLRRNWTTTQKHTQTASETITINLDSSCKLSGFFCCPLWFIPTVVQSTVRKSPQGQYLLMIDGVSRISQSIPWCDQLNIGFRSRASFVLSSALPFPSTGGAVERCSVNFVLVENGRVCSLRSVGPYEWLFRKKRKGHGFKFDR